MLHRRACADTAPNLCLSRSLLVTSLSPGVDGRQTCCCLEHCSGLRRAGLTLAGWARLIIAPPIPP
eukprot:419687-Rhodomonas_salina.1